MRTCIIVGAGAQGRVTLEAWRAAAPDARFVFVDDNTVLHGTDLLGAKVVGGLSCLTELEGEVVLAIGNNAARLALAERLSATPARTSWGTVVHPSAIVMPSARVAPGAVLLAGAIVNSQAVIGPHVIVNTGVIVEHDCKIDEGVSLSPGTRMGGRVHIGRGAFVATGVTLAPRMTVGAYSVVGAGAVVVNDVPERALAYGVPARVRGTIDASFDWTRVL